MVDFFHKKGVDKMAKLIDSDNLSRLTNLLDARMKEAVLAEKERANIAEIELQNNIDEVEEALNNKANKEHGTHLTLGTGSGNAFRGDYGNTAYNHSQAAHAPSNAQKNSDITKAEIEAKLTGTVTSHNHSGTYAPASHTSDTTVHITAAERTAWNAKSNLTLGTGSGNAFRGDYGNTAYTHSQAAHAPSNAQKNSDITKAEIEAKLTGAITSHTHSYLPLSGGTMTGKITTPNNAQGITIGDDISLCDRNIADHLVLEGSTATNGGITFGSGKDTNIYRGGANILKTDDTMNAVGGFQWNGQSLDSRYAAASHGTHLTLGTGSGNAYRGDYGNTAYNHSQAAHAPSNAQKNSDITKAEIEAKLTGDITSHNHTSLTGITSLTFAANSDDSSVIKITKDSAVSYTDFIMSDDAGSDMWRWRFKAWDSSASGTTAEFNLMTLKATSTTKGQLSVNGNITADSFTEGGTALSSKYAAASHGTHLTLGTGSGNAFRGDYGNTAYNHSQAAHAPSNAQKNSDITKAEIEAKLTGAITSHTHTAVNGYTIWVGTQAQYDAISSKSSTTIYYIKS